MKKGRPFKPLEELKDYGNGMRTITVRVSGVTVSRLRKGLELTGKTYGKQIEELVIDRLGK